MVPTTAEEALAQALALYQQARYPEGLSLTARALSLHPGSPDLWNLHGVMLRQLRRQPEALAALDKALAIQSDHMGATVNRANVLVDLGQAARAEPIFAELAQGQPGNPHHHLGLGRARLRLGRAAEGAQALRQAAALQPQLLSAWLELAQCLVNQEDARGAVAALDEALSANPENLALLEGKAMLLRTAGPQAEAVAYLTDLVGRQPDLPWAHQYLGDLLAERADPAAEAHLRRAVALAPGGISALLSLVQFLARSTGPEEGRRFDEAHALAARALAAGQLDAHQLKVVRDVLSQACDFRGLDRLGSFADLGRAWAQAGLHTALMRQLARVRTRGDRLELLEQHRTWGRARLAEAERQPIRRPPPRAPGDRIRLGLLSSDLRRHPVGYFVEPLFEHLDASRFELFCYGFDPRPMDALQATFAARATAFRNLPQAGAREMAQVIADDDLDLLVELGGTTEHNRVETTAWRPAPRQASWLGYAHSAGLPTIEGLICDRFNAPSDPGLLAEEPWVLPNSWIALGRSTFKEEHAIDPCLPEEQQGFLTFGTANAAYKYTPEALSAWAAITAAVPHARFVFLRPEAGSAAFRANVAAAFAAEGVAPERIVFRPVRGGHMPFYNEIDITLDTFPHTGGTTTVEALWMGVPVISLRGEAFYERLSWSILANLGLDDLAADDLAGYRAAALALAADRPRRAVLRTALRQRFRESALGDTAAFARDFYALVERMTREAGR